MFKRVFVQFVPEDLFPVKLLSVVRAFKSTGFVNYAHNKKIRPCNVENEEIDKKQDKNFSQ